MYRNAQSQLNKRLSELTDSARSGHSLRLGKSNFSPNEYLYVTTENGDHLFLESSFAESWVDPADGNQYWLIFREHGDAFVEAWADSTVIKLRRVYE